MDAVINILVEILRLVPLILVFFIPALFAMAIWRERGESYKVKAILMLTVSCGLVVFVQLVLRSVSATQIAATLAVSLVQIAAALSLAALTVYKLAD
jgi:uncharacterized membrane protein